MEALRATPVRHDRFLAKNVEKLDRSKPRGGQVEKMTDHSRPSKHSMVDGSPDEQQAKMMCESKRAYSDIIEFVSKPVDEGTGAA